jgi:carbonic anhydrase/acetyltransferase-like protein (isoleucine patch superfamily)
VLNGARVGSESLLAAGAVVLEGSEAPPRSLLTGVPAKVRGELDDDKAESLRENGRIYQRLRDEYQTAQAGGSAT